MARSVQHYCVRRSSKLILFNIHTTYSINNQIQWVWSRSHPH